MSEQQHNQEELYTRSVEVLRQAVAHGCKRDDVLAVCYLAGVDSRDVYKQEQQHG